MTKEIELGDIVKDRHTGFTGLVEVISDYLYQCRQIAVRPQKLSKDGTIVDAKWFDEPQLELVKKGVVKPKARVEVEGKRVSGGPERAHPPSRNAR